MNWKYSQSCLEKIVDDLDKNNSEKVIVKLGGLEEIAKRLESDLKDGIPEAEKENEYLERQTHASLAKAIVNRDVNVENGDFPVYLIWMEGLTILVVLFFSSCVPMTCNCLKGSMEGLSERNTSSRLQEAVNISENRVVTVIRGGKMERIPSSNLYPGDVVLLSDGETIAADGILIQGYDLRVDESSVTGETKLIQKNHSFPLLRSGTVVSEGAGSMFVIAIGKYSLWGRMFLDVSGELEEGQRNCCSQLFSSILDSLIIVPIYRLKRCLQCCCCCYYFKICSRKSNIIGEDDIIDEDEELELEDDDDYDDDGDERSPLFRKIGNLESIFCFVVFGVAFFSYLFLMIGWFISNFLPKITWSYNYIQDEKCTNYFIDNASDDDLKDVHNCGSISDDLINLLMILIFVVTLIIVAVPEILPLVTSFSLASRIKRMLKQNILIRRLHACETIGRVTTICSGKTGTLTLNEMHATTTWIAGTHYFDSKTVNKEELDEDVWRLISEGISVTSSANLIINEQKNNDQNNTTRKVQGNKTEGALLLFLSDMGCNYKTIREHYEDQELYLRKFTFSSEKKRITSVVRLPDFGIVRVYCKGSPEIVLGLCSMQRKGDHTERLDEEEKHKLQDNIIRKMAENGLRNLCLAYRDFTEKEMEDKLEEKNIEEMRQEEFEEDLVLLLIAGIKDPIRPDIVGAVKKCRAAGVSVRMVTGDILETAVSVAKECNIYDEEKNHVCLEGDHFRYMSDRKVKEILPRLRILSRSRPRDKKRLVRLLKSQGEVVAMTGDGTNDAPALKTADVGLSMGISGTEVAKEASDIVVLDDSFNTIVNAVILGRSVLDNVRKFLQLQITFGVVVCSMFVICSMTHFIKIRDEIGGYSAVVEPFQFPFTPVQLLWVSFFITFAGISLSIEGSSTSLLSSSSSSLVNWKIWCSVLVQSTYQICVLLFIHYIGFFIPVFQSLMYGSFRTVDWNDGIYPLYEWIGENKVFKPWVKSTMVFNTFSLMQFLNVFLCRKVNLEWNICGSICKSLLLLIVFFLALPIQFVVVEAGTWQPLRLICGTTGLEWYQWLICIILALGCIPLHFVKNLAMVIINLMCRFCKMKIKENKRNLAVDEDIGDIEVDEEEEEEENSDISDSSEDESSDEDRF